MLTNEAIIATLEDHGFRTREVAGEVQAFEESATNGIDTSEWVTVSRDVRELGHWLGY